MRSISHIFPDSYPNPPSAEELLFEANEMLCRYQCAPQIIHALQHILCPYYREAIALSFQYNWHQREQLFDELTGYYDGDGDWRKSWIEIDADIRSLIRHAHNEQVKLENPTTPPYNTQNNSIQQPTKTKTIMPLFINRQEGTIYNNCTFNYAAQQPTTTQQDVEQAPATPTFFRTDCHAITTIQQIWQQALQLPTKTKVIRFLLQHDHTDGYFHLNHLTYQQRAQLLNEAQDKFCFKAKDFENANN